MKDHVKALAAFYQAEKTDASGVFRTAMAMMAIGGAYLCVMITNIYRFGSGPGDWLILLVLPLPLWLIAAFQSLMTLNAMSHGVSVQIIEDALFAESALPAGTRNYVGSVSGDKIMDINKSRFIHHLTTYIVYIGVGMLVIGFTSYTVYLTWHPPYIASVVAIVVYVLLAIIIGISWRVGFSIIKEAEKCRSDLREQRSQALTEDRPEI